MVLKWAVAFVVGIAIGFAWWASSAAASPWDDRAQEIARHRYGNVCDGRVLLTSAPLAGPIARASWMWFYRGGPKFACVVTYDTSVVEHMTWPEFCTTMVHEYGHLGEWNENHSLNPKSIMFWRPTATYRLCRGEFK